MSEPESEHYFPPVLPVRRQPMIERRVPERRATERRAPERRKSVLSIIDAWVDIRDLLLPPDAADRSNTAVVARVRELVGRESMDEDDLK